MGWALRKQRFQDWFTQQWAIVWGKKIDPCMFPWLVGPFGNLDGIGEGFIQQLAEEEDLIVERNGKARGLIQSIGMLGLPENALARLSPGVIHFYENTSDYELEVRVDWNPFFKGFGVLVNRLFSHRIDQLNIPISNERDAQSLTSEIITLNDPQTGEVKYTVWLRMSKTDNRVMYSGIYGTCALPSGQIGIKAVFPLPQGNASVILLPSVGNDGELTLHSDGRRIGDAGFYFVLKDVNGNHWAQFIASFRDRLVVRQVGDHIAAEQTLTLWGMRVLGLDYRIVPKP